MKLSERTIPRDKILKIPRERAAERMFRYLQCARVFATIMVDHFPLFYSILCMHSVVCITRKGLYDLHYTLDYMI